MAMLIIRTDGFACATDGQDVASKGILKKCLTPPALLVRTTAPELGSWLEWLLHPRAMQGAHAGSICSLLHEGIKNRVLKQVTRANKIFWSEPSYNLA